MNEPNLFGIYQKEPVLGFTLLRQPLRSVSSGVERVYISKDELEYSYNFLVTDPYEKPDQTVMAIQTINDNGPYLSLEFFYLIISWFLVYHRRVIKLEIIAIYHNTIRCVQSDKHSLQY